jgi:hypothetical protein
MKRLALLALLLTGCERAPAPDATPGGRLEATAVARGLVADSARAGLAGVWASETDRICIVPGAKATTLGVSVDYGEGQACAAAGTVTPKGDRLDVRLDDCRFEAGFDGERITFPAALPSGCGRHCRGRASLSAATAERQSEAVSEARLMRGPAGQALCGG